MNNQKTFGRNGKCRLLALVMLLCLCGCGRYEGHNGYFFAWRDFERSHIVVADLNKDGETTDMEMKMFTRQWLSGKSLTLKEGSHRVYDKQGKSLSAEEFASKF